MYVYKLHLFYYTIVKNLGRAFPASKTQLQTEMETQISLDIL